MAAPWKTAWITGASTGIGREMALQLAHEGVRVAVSARSKDKLDELAALSPSIVPVPVDVTHREDVARAHALVAEQIGPIELAIFNAGVWHPMKSTRLDAGPIADGMAVNYLGIVNCLEPLIPALIAQGGGRIGLVASVAGYRGLPKALAYAPTKAATISLAEMLRTDLAPYKIKVSVINPGFVETPMTAVNKFPMPYMIKAEDAAARIVKGLETGKFEIVFPWQMMLMMKTVRLLPNWLYFQLMRRIAAAS